MPAELLTERPHPHTLVLTISDPATRNTLSPQVYAAGVEALNTAEHDTAVRCVILRGAGDHFCGGGNLQRLVATRALGEVEGPAQQAQSVERLGSFVETLYAFPKPIIAAVEGFAAGAGFSLALGCDLIVAAEDAKFVMSYGKVGLSPDGGGSWQLARRVPSNVALKMLWLPEPVTASQALAWGLVNEIAPKGLALSVAMTLASRLALMAPNAVASAKELQHAAMTNLLGDQLKLEAQHFVANAFHANGGEGMQAFLDKRPPVFG